MINDLIGRWSEFNDDELHDIICALWLMIQNIKEDNGDGSKRHDRICQLLREASKAQGKL